MGEKKESVSFKTSIGLNFILLSTLLVGGYFLLSMSSVSDASLAQSQGLNYQGHVCIYKNGELVECSSNILFNNGANLTRDILGQGFNMGAILNISLCNATAGAGCGVPGAGANELYTAYTGVANCGLAAVNGAYGTLPSPGGGANWSIFRTFTSTCDSVLTNSTRLTNASGSVFAGNTFTLVTLQTNDQLTINWTLSVS